MSDSQQISDLHRQRYDFTPLLFRAPGRVNLIGEHTDYAEGFVMPAAINFSTLAAVSPAAQNTATLFSVNFNEEITVPLDQIPPRGHHHWSDYPLGVLDQLRRAGISIPGFHLTLSGDVPLGSGLSSSASLEVATGAALLGLAQQSMPLPDLAKLARRAEVEYVGANVGIMDQFISCCGRADHALLLDCRDLSFSYSPIPTTVALVIVNSMVKHSHAGGQYNTRRAEVEEATQVLARHLPNVRTLRDATPEQLAEYASQMSPNAFKRGRHIITDSLRAQQMATDFKRGDMAAIGRLMAEAHQSYSQDFEASTPEIDTLVRLAQPLPGLIGARLTGGGFGGCTVNLVEAPLAQEFATRLAADYKKATGIQADHWVCHASQGVHPA